MTELVPNSFGPGLGRRIRKGPDAKPFEKTLDIDIHLSSKTTGRALHRLSSNLRAWGYGNVITSEARAEPWENIITVPSARCRFWGPLQQEFFTPDHCKHLVALLWAICKRMKKHQPYVTDIVYTEYDLG